MNAPADPGIRLLLVTRDGDMRASVTSEATSRAKILVACCTESGREALARLAAWRPDVLIVALPLSDFDDVGFVRAAKRIHSRCQILLVCGRGREEDSLAAIEAGAAGCVPEPCEVRELVEHALKLRAGGSPLCPFVARKLVERLHARTLPLAAAAAALTARESDVICLLADGLSYAQIGDRLGVSLNTVGSHIKNVYRKLDVHSATAAVMRAMELQALDRTSPRPGLSSPDHGIVDDEVPAHH